MRCALLVWLLIERSFELASGFHFKSSLCVLRTFTNFHIARSRHSHRKRSQHEQRGEKCDMNRSGSVSGVCLAITSSTANDLIKDVFVRSKQSRADRSQLIDDLGALVETYGDHFNRVNAVTLLQRSASHRCDLIPNVVSYMEIIAMLERPSQYTRNLRKSTKAGEPVDDFYSAADLAHLMYGLRAVTGPRAAQIACGNSDDVLSSNEFIQYVTRTVHTALQPIATSILFSGKQISGILAGFEYLHNSDSTDRLLQDLLPIFRRSHTAFVENSQQNSPGLGKTNFMTGLEISNALFGLQRMTSQLESVRQVTDFLATVVDDMDPRTIKSGKVWGNAFYGLRGMSSEYMEVLRLLKAMNRALTVGAQTDALARWHDSFTARDIGRTLEGFYSMSSSAVEVRSTLQSLLDFLFVPVTQNSDVKFDELALRCGLKGMRKFSDDAPVVRDLLDIIVVKLLDTPVTNFSSFTVATMLSSLRNMNANSRPYRDALAAISLRIPSSQSEIRFQSHQIGAALLGLRSVRSLIAVPSARNILQSFNCHIKEYLKEQHSPIRAEHLAMALYGLRNILCYDCEETREFLALVPQLVRAMDSPRPLSPKSFGMAMIGFSGVDIDCTSSGSKTMDGSSTDASIENGKRVYYDFLQSALLAVASLMPARLDGQAIGNSLSAMHRMSSDSPVVRQIISLLTMRIESYDKIMSTRDLSISYYGMQTMDSRHAEVVALVAALNKKHLNLFSDDIALGSNQRRRASFTAKGCSNAVLGLRCMNCGDSPHVKAAVGLLAERIEECSEVMKPMDIAHAIFGLQSMDDATEEVRAMLDAIYEQMLKQEAVVASNTRIAEHKFKKRRTFQYTEKDIGFCVAGLQGLMRQRYLHHEIDQLFLELNVKIARSKLAGLPQVNFVRHGRGVRMQLPVESANK